MEEAMRGNKKFQKQEVHRRSLCRFASSKRLQENNSDRHNRAR